MQDRRSVKLAGLLIMLFALIVVIIWQSSGYFAILVYLIIFLAGSYAYRKPRGFIIKSRHIGHKLFVFRKELLLLLAVLLFCFVVLELTSRRIFPDTKIPINRYGWDPPHNITIFGVVQDSINKSRKINLTYFNHGFKRWGNINTNKTKILVLGDSFTEAYVSNGEEYYSYLDKYFDVELFVFGSNGYGSLQEFMILDDFIDIIKPDIILWQFCDNDYPDNLYEYDIKANYPLGPIFHYRPYLEDGKIIYRKPLPFSDLRKHSKFFSYLVEIYSNFVARIALKRYNAGAYAQKITGIPGRMKDASLKSTITIITMAKNRAKDAPIYFFSVNSLTEREELICSRANITCVPGVAECVEKKEFEGIPVASFDGHWNQLGNHLVGEFLVNYFKKTMSLEMTSPKNKSRGHPNIS